MLFHAKTHYRLHQCHPTTEDEFRRQRRCKERWIGRSIRRLLRDRHDRFKREHFVNSNDTMVQGISNVDGSVAGCGGDGPAERDVWLGFQTFRTLAVEIAVGAEANHFIVGVITHGNGKRDTVGDVQASEVVHVKSRLGASACAHGAPTADRTATRILL